MTSLGDTGGRTDGREVRDGDIFRWRYVDEKPHDLGAYRRYHCKSQIAVFENGVLRDTYWHSKLDGHLDRESVILEFQGNAFEMEKIPFAETVFYRPQDIVDMRHANDSGAQVYAKGPRNAEAMKSYFEYAIERTNGEIKSRKARLEECERVLEAIAAGELYHSFPVYRF